MSRKEAAEAARELLYLLPTQTRIAKLLPHIWDRRVADRESQGCRYKVRLARASPLSTLPIEAVHMRRLENCDGPGNVACSVVPGSLTSRIALFWEDTPNVNFPRDFEELGSSNTDILDLACLGFGTSRGYCGAHAPTHESDHPECEGPKPDKGIRGRIDGHSSISDISGEPWYPGRSSYAPQSLLRPKRRRTRARIRTSAQMGRNLSQAYQDHFRKRHGMGSLPRQHLVPRKQDETCVLWRRLSAGWLGWLP
ncbi:hypothetical protein C8R47DRAFT_395704 [Mycena vitilis]|nr:hypothetical protein C8R47DRAFT_395704 [Mycena vitilis]